MKRILFLLLAALLLPAILSGCSSSEEDEKSAAHNFSAYNIVKNAGYDEEGELTRRCLDEGCGKTETLKIKASQGLSYEETAEGVFVAGVGSCRDAVLYISSRTPDGKQVYGVDHAAFIDNGKIEHLIIEKGVSFLGDGAFAGCERLLSASLPDGLTEWEPTVFSKCGRLIDVRFPADLTSIPMNSFNECSALLSVILPESVSEIGYSAFNLCSSLTEIVLPKDLVKIGSCAFSDCTALTGIVFNDKLQSIGSYAFSHCTSLVRVELPASLETLESCAFFKDTSLALVFIPRQVVTISAPEDLSPFYDSNRSLILRTDAETKPDGWADRFDVFYAPDTLDEDGEIIRLTVEYGKTNKE